MKKLMLIPLFAGIIIGLPAIAGADPVPAGGSGCTSDCGQAASVSGAVVAEHLGKPIAYKKITIERAIDDAVVVKAVNQLATDAETLQDSAGQFAQLSSRKLSSADGQIVVDTLVAINNAVSTVEDVIERMGEKDPVAMKALNDFKEKQGKRDDGQDARIDAVEKKVTLLGGYITGASGHETLVIDRLHNSGRGTLRGDGAGSFRYSVLKGPNGTPERDFTVVAIERLAEGKLIIYHGFFFDGQGDKPITLQRFYGTFTVKSVKWWIDEAFNGTSNDFAWLCESTFKPVPYADNDQVNVSLKSRSVPQ